MIVAGAPGAARAQTHASDLDGSYWTGVLGGGQGCYTCHTLDDTEGDPDTSYINATSGVLADMRRFNTPPNTTPVNLGCVYCHFRTGQTKMRGVLSHFAGNRSQHPLGRTFTGATPYVDTQNAYLSSDGTSATDEMDCLDCHDPSMIIYDYAASGGSGANDPRYMIHSPTPQNPFMLRNVSVVGQYDAFCRGCHGAGAPATFKGKDVRLHSHADGSNDGADAIRETDGTLLRTTDPDGDGVADAPADQCTKCHDAHYSANAKLLNDGKSDTAVSATNCTALCHYAGDRFGNYLTHGHGAALSTYEYSGVRLPGNKPCTGCHQPLDLETPNAAGSRKAHAEKRPIGANPSPADYKANFGLTIDLLVADGGTPTGNPVNGICWSCHGLGTYKAHHSYENTPVGCQDCHDEHAEGSGAASNVFMIPETAKGAGFYVTPTRTPVPGEAIVYDTPRYQTNHTDLSGGPYDFYSSSGAGVCDNTACHGADQGGGTRPGPLGTLMGTGPGDTQHSGGYQAPASDCGVCHTHGDPAGGWGARGYCDGCHASTDPAKNTTGIARTHTDAKESLTRHNLHANSPLIAGGCAACHPHDGKTVPPGTGSHMDGTVTFGGARLGAALNYAGSAFPDAGCTAANGCHDAQADEWKRGLGTGQGGCVDCHDAGLDGVANKDLDQGGWPNPTKSGSGKHVAHQASPYVTGDGVQANQCTDCHGAGADVGGHTGHKDGAVEVATAGTNVKVTGYEAADPKTCTNLCHEAGIGPAGRSWTAGSLVCLDCHAGPWVGGGPNAPASGLHAASAVTRHDATLLGGGCVNCHAAAGPSDAHIDGTLDTAATATFVFHANVVGYDRSAGCRAAGTCHGGGDAGTWRRRWLGVVDAVPGTSGNDAAGQAVCQNCHGDFTGWRWDEGDATTTDHTDPYGGNAGDRMGEHGACERCHGWGHAGYVRTWGTGDHGNGTLEMNGPDTTHGAPAGNQYDDTTGGCAFACHGAAFVASTNSGWTVAYGDYGLGDCGACHGPGGIGPTVVWPAGDAVGRRTAYGSHLGATSAEEGPGFLGGVGAAWAGQCNKCHATHAGTVKVPAPPASWADPSGRLNGTNMRTQLGLPYALEANVAVHLGGSAQGGASEAEFCWGCHDANAVSEWGFNTKTTPAGFPVTTFATADGNLEAENHGWIYQSDFATKVSDWTLGYWKSPYDAALARRVASVHSASFDLAGQSSSVAANVSAGVVNRTSPSYESRTYLRCTNCHDVHDTFGPNGKPYLRGAWTGNPYPPELPPRATYTYTTGVDTATGAKTPRGLSTSRDKGGYFVDQNSGWPTKNAALDTLAETAGLCALCHGSNVDTMDYYPGSKLWLPATVNGHSNSCLGGTGANKRDLFTGSRYGAGMGMQSSVGGMGGCDANYPQYQCGVYWCPPSGCQSIVNSGWYWGSGAGNPAGTFTAGGGDFANWYGVGTIGGADGPGSKAHAFTCSKCHTPHASGLPALLIQNCVDPGLGSFAIGGKTGTNLIANNCHRKTSANDGWHVLAPGQ